MGNTLTTEQINRINTRIDIMMKEAKIKLIKEQHTE
jgi:hypothetical protein